MSLITLCIVLLCLQPLIIYKVMFSEKEKSKEEIEFPLSFLVIAPCFVYFYLDTFGYALLLLGSVSILGGILAKLCEKKARNSMPLEDLLALLVAWFIIFSVGYGIGVLWDYISSFWQTPTTPVISEITNSEIPIDIHAPVEAGPKVSLLTHMTPSISLLLLTGVLFLIRLFDIYSSSKKEYSGFFFIFLAIAAALLPQLSEYYVLSLIFNFFVLVAIGGNIILYKETDPSSGAIGFFYMYVFMCAISLSWMYRGIVWLFSF